MAVNHQPQRQPLCVHVLPTTEQAGAETRARELIAGLSEAGGFDLELVYFQPGRAHRHFDELGISLRQIPKRARFAVDFPRLSWRLRKLYSDRPPPILHTWMTQANVAGLLAARAWPETRVIVTQCAGLGEELYYRRHLQVQRALIGRADHAISNSTDGAAVLERLGMPQPNISVIMNGISPQRVALTRGRDEVRAELGLAPEVATIAVATRANDRWAFGQKNIGGMLAAMEHVRRAIPDARLMLIGPTAEELSGFGVELPRWAQATGFVSRAADYLASADAVAIPSNSEGTSNVACEALMLGMPVATTAVGDHVPIVEEAGGRSAPVGDPAGLAEGLVNLVQAPPSPQHVKEVARRHLGLDRMVTSTAAIYSSVLSAEIADRSRRRPLRLGRARAQT